VIAAVPVVADKISPAPYPTIIGKKGQTPRILVADDNADMRHYVSGLLSAHYQVQAVADGRMALAAARENPPDLVLADVMMPHLDGFGLLSELRADTRTRDTPVIMLSARAGEEARVEGLQAGADDYLIKPFNARELLTRVDAFLTLMQMRQANKKALEERDARRAALNVLEDAILAKQALSESRAQLARELEDAKQLQKISSALIEDENNERLYEQILDAAMAIMRADFGSLQMLDAERSALRLLTWRNFNPESAQYWRTVSIKTATSCGSALRHGKRIIVPDVNTADFLQGTEDLRQYLLSGILAVQSTPLITREGRGSSA
jgi:DNA-binding response OmpR family regulator